MERETCIYAFMSREQRVVHIFPETKWSQAFMNGGTKVDQMYIHVS